MHGGLFSKDSVSLEEIKKTDRNRQPPDEGNSLLFYVIRQKYILFQHNIDSNMMIFVSKTDLQPWMINCWVKFLIQLLV